MQSIRARVDLELMLEERLQRMVTEMKDDVRTKICLSFVCMTCYCIVDEIGHTTNY